MNVDAKLEELGDRLERSVAADLSSEQRTFGAATTWARRRRPRLLAGSSLGLAGIGAAVVFGLSGTAATTPAFAITRHDDGSVLVQLNSQEDIAQANQKLVAMGINEQITLYSNATPTAATTPEDCAQGPDAPAPNPPIRVVVNTNNADNTGTTGAVVCVVGPHTYSGPYPGSSGDTSSGNSGVTTAGTTSAG
ncbi:MAG: hypothetical protein WAL22_18960 [Solirubrobacteraceae bacterium]